MRGRKTQGISPEHIIFAIIQASGDDIEQLRNSMHNLQNLSEQLDPLESAYADVRFFDVGVEQTQQQFDVSFAVLLT
jgi:DNA-binding FadR family transcriptional regulator